MELEDIIKKVNDTLKHHEDYKDDDEMKVRYIMLDKDNNIQEIICYGADTMLIVDPNDMEIREVMEWAYTVDNDIFGKLENGMKISYMHDEEHYNIWNETNEYYPEDINHTSGMKMYLDYCKNNGITKEYLDNKLGLNVPDIVTRVKIDDLKPQIEKALNKELETTDETIKEIKFALVDKNNPDIITVHSEIPDDKILISSFSKDKNIENTLVDRWNYSYENWLLKELNSNQRIGYMPIKTHKEVWREIGLDNFSYAPNNDFIKNYLDYCKRNHITQESLYPENCKDIPNVFDYYETSKNYFDLGDKKVVMSRNVFDESSEKYYYTFALGYDFLNNMIVNSSYPECDTSYDFCYKLAEEFMKSDEYKDTSKSAYEMLGQWVNNNMQNIQLKYDDYIGVDNNISKKLDNGIYVIKTGYRKDQPIALLEKTVEDEKEYIIAFNYKIEDNKIEWAYGYYYAQNVDKSREDFKKAISGGYLDNTFIHEDKEAR